MNKYQESLSYIIDNYIDMHYEGRPMNEDTEHALRLQELVDKETPKKPVEIQDDIFGDYHLVCPNCGQGAIVIATRTDGKLYPRCPFCGQKLREEDKDDC